MVLTVYCPACSESVYTLRKEPVTDGIINVDDFLGIEGKTVGPKGAELTFCPFCKAEILKRERDGNYVFGVLTDKGWKP